MVRSGHSVSRKVPETAQPPKAQSRQWPLCFAFRFARMTFRLIQHDCKLPSLKGGPHVFQRGNNNVIIISLVTCLKLQGRPSIHARGAATEQLNPGSTKHTVRPGAPVHTSEDDRGTLPRCRAAAAGLQGCMILIPGPGGEISCNNACARTVAQVPESLSFVSQVADQLARSSHRAPWCARAIEREARTTPGDSPVLLGG